MRKPRGAGAHLGFDGGSAQAADALAGRAHEIGHLLGLGHCTNRECVMFKPDTLDELDRKKKQLCSSCYGQMAAFLNPPQ